MATIFMKQAVRALLTTALSLAAITPCRGAVTLLQNCFGAPQTYTTSFDHEFSSSENIANHDYDVPDHLVGNGPDSVANCSCPANLFSSSTIYEKTLAGSPLSPGTNGYGYLTDKIDADITGYADAINSPDGSFLTPLTINEYPTPRGSMHSVTESSLSKTEGDASVCSSDTRPSGAAAVKRNFRWNVVAIVLHVKKPILGQEVIPPTIVAQNYACLYFGTGGKLRSRAGGTGL
ncbi:hypothetical protein [Enterobacter mori]|uniref:hypothetical protein n=1 Tax=Enterobacter mori TaxID=539813 RepID=UPI00301AA223